MRRIVSFPAVSRLWAGVRSIATPSDEKTDSGSHPTISTRLQHQQNVFIEGAVLQLTDFTRYIFQQCRIACGADTSWERFVDLLDSCQLEQLMVTHLVPEIFPLLLLLQRWYGISFGRAFKEQKP